MNNFKDKKADDILEKLVHINRITKVVKGGRRFSCHKTSQESSRKENYKNIL